jgi:mannitol operon transcriptional antiterminator
MELTSRQRKALSFLLRDGGEATLAELAAKIGVSSRTVHRELAAVAPLLFSSFGLVLSGKSGRGLRIEGERASIEACLNEISQESAAARPASGRRAFLAAAILDSGEGIKLLALSTDLAAPIAAVRGELESLRPWLHSHGLRLTLRRGLGVRLEGGEASLRRAWCALICGELGDDGLLDLIRAGDEAVTSGPEHPSFRDFVGRRLGPATLRLAESLLSSLPKGSLPPLALSDYLGLVVLLAVAAARLREGHACGEDGADGMADGPPPAAAILMADAATRAFGVVFGPPETAALGLHLRGSKPESAAEDILDGAGIDGLEAVGALVRECDRITGKAFGEDRLLRDGLLAHWPPALFRLRHGLPVHNPLLGRIRTAYSGLFDAVAEAAASVLPGIAVPDEEIAYLVLHFGSSVERRERGRSRFRALVVCSAGIGSAQMLASRLRAEFPEIEVVANVSWFDIKDLPRESYDFLVSTVPLPLERQAYVLVNPLLDAEGVEEVRAAISERERSLRAGQSAGMAGAAGGVLPAAPGGDLIRFLGAGMSMLEGIRVFPGAVRGEGWEGLLHNALSRCSAAGLVQDPSAALADLAERSKDGGILLPGGRVLFLHARTASAPRASFSVHALDAPVGDAPGGRRVEARLVALMLAPPSTSAEIQSILNEISVSLLDPATEAILGEVDEAALRAYYARCLDRYIRSNQAQGDR